jgi:hypothetical protein
MYWITLVTRIRSKLCSAAAGTPSARSSSATLPSALVRSAVAARMPAAASQ